MAIMTFYPVSHSVSGTVNNPSNAYALDDSYASITSAKNSTRSLTLNFDTSSLPSDATVTKVTIYYKMYRDLPDATIKTLTFNELNITPTETPTISTLNWGTILPTQATIVISMGNSKSGYPTIYIDCVWAEVEYTTPIKPTGITVVPNSAELTIGDTQQLTVTVTPTGALDEVTYETSSSSIATVSTDGLVTAVGYGDCTITVRSVNNTSITAICNVTVEPPPIIQPESLTLNYHNVSMVYKETFELIPTILPSDAEQSVTVEISNPIVSYTDGVVKPINYGSGDTVITIRSTANPDIYDSCTVTVWKSLDEIVTGFTNDDIDLPKGETALLIAEPYPTDTGIDFEIVSATSGQPTYVEVLGINGKTVSVRSLVSSGSSMIIAKLRFIGKICDGEIFYREITSYATVNCTEATSEPEEFTGVFMAIKGNNLYLHTDAGNYMEGISLTNVAEDITDNSAIYLDSNGVIHCKALYTKYDDLLLSN